MFCGIYKITMEDRFYIGSSKNINQRKRTHIRTLEQGIHSNIVMQRSYNKNKHFKFDVMFYCSPESRLIEEQRLIDIYIDNPKSLNISRSAFAPTSNEKQKEATRKACIGRVTSPETRMKISLAGKGRKVSQANIDALRERNKHMTFSKETRVKMSISAKARSIGENNSNSKINKETAMYIYNLKDKITSIQLEKEIPVCSATIRAIWSKRNWKSIHE